MMASKFLYDEGVDDEVFNDEWAASADMETEDINEMERQFLSAIDWRLYVNEKEFVEVLQEVERKIALTQGVDRGWFSYTDLWAVSQDPQLLQTLNELSSLVPKVLAVSMMAYIAGLLTVVGSTLLVTSTLTSLTSVPLPTKQHAILPTLGDVTVSDEGQQVTQEKTETVEDSKPRVLDGSLTSLWTLLTLPSILSLSNPGLSKQSTSAKKTSVSNENSTGLDDDNGWMKDTSGLSQTGSKFFSLLSDIVSFSLPQRQRTDSMTNQIVCAKGPCLFSGQNINCKNVSKLQSSWLANSRQDQMDSEQNDVDRRFSQCKHCEARKALGARNVGRFCDSGQRVVDWTFNWYADVSCCCDHVTADLDRSLISNGFADISLGFRTMLTPIPILGT